MASQIAPSAAGSHAAPMASVALPSFVYSAQTEHGLRLSGTLEAADGAAAIVLLESMRLRVLNVSAAKAPAAHSDGNSLGCFHRQLAQAVGSGMSLETGLRLAAASMPPGKIGRILAAIAVDLKRGLPMADALDKHRRLFPSVYQQLIEAASGKDTLASVLGSLGQHFETKQHLGALMWRSISYPVMTLCGLLLVLSFIGLQVIPRFRDTFAELRMHVPAVTDVVFSLAEVAPYVALVVIGTLLLGVITWSIFRVLGAEKVWTDRLLLAAPMLGPVLRLHLVWRWLDVTRMGDAAGMELPAAIAMANNSVASASLRADGDALISAIVSGNSLAAVPARLLPANVPLAIETTSNPGDVHATLAVLCELYERQTRLRAERIRSVMTPLLLILTAVLIGSLLFAIMLPLNAFIQEMTSMTVRK